MTTADWIKRRRDVRQLYHWTCTEGAAGIRGHTLGVALWEAP